MHQFVRSVVTEILIFCDTLVNVETDSYYISEAQQI